VKGSSVKAKQVRELESKIATKKKIKASSAK